MSDKERGIIITSEDKQYILEQSAKKYADELVESGDIKDYDRSWIESVFLFIAKSDAVSDFHAKEKFESSGTERLKTAWRYLNKLVVNDDLDGAIDFIKIFMFPEYDFKILRTLLDVTSKVSNEEKIIPIRKELIRLCEQKLGEKLY